MITELLSVGQTVYWSEQSGKRPIETQISRLETILRPDGSKIDCASLTCNRFVPVSSLMMTVDDFCAAVDQPVQQRPARQRSPEFRRGDSPAPAGQSPRPELEESGKRKAESRRGTDDAKLSAVSPPEPAQVTTENLNPEKSNDSERSALRSPLSALNGPLLIDFNNLLVRAWHAAKPTEIHAIKSMFQTIANAVRTLRPSALVFCLDGGHAHRAKLLPSYKAHRPPSDPNLVSQRQLAVDAIKAAGLQLMHVDGFEADDVIGTLAMRETAAVILSSDKDLLSLGGKCRVYHPWGAGSFKTASEVLGVEPGQVVDFLALCGDTSDGVPGVHGIGEKTAAALLQEYGDLETILTAARTLRIPGANGKKLQAGSADALLSQQLVTLVTNLPLPPVAPWQPKDGWQAKLTDMRLGSIAGILDGIAKLLPSDAVQEPASGLVEKPKAESGKPMETAAMVLRSISEPIRTNLTISQRWDGPDKGLISCWEAGRERAGSAAENPWREGTANHLAWQQGWNLQDLKICHSDDRQAKPYRPSNGTEGEIFISAMCSRCSRDVGNGGNCSIIVYSMTYQTSDPHYPLALVWRNGKPTCTEFAAIVDPPTPNAVTSAAKSKGLFDE